MSTPLSLAEIEARAEARLDPVLWNYLMAGAGSGLTLRDNVEAWERLRLLPHVVTAVAAVSTATTLLGTPVASPIMVAPTGRATRFHPDGEAAVLAAAAASGTIAILPSSVGHAVPALAAGCPEALFWCQMYFTNDRGSLAADFRRAEEAGCRAIVLTVDLVDGSGSGAVLPAPFKPEWENAMAPPSRRIMVDPGPEDLEWMCRTAGLPIVVKGVLRADDAVRCVDAGAGAVIVSNHGGNQLDGLVATAQALPPIVAAVGHRAEVYVDGGIRSGASALKALALGARAVLIGRPATQGLAADGAAGQAAVLERLTAELGHAQRLCGAGTLTELHAGLIVNVGAIGTSC